MSLPVPNLHKKNYDALREEMLSSIKKYNSEWTNYNPSDPGITVIELLSWLGEHLLYRIDHLPKKAYLNFLRLVAGATGDQIDDVLSQKDLDPEYKDLLEFLRTLEDYFLFSIVENVEEIMKYLLEADLNETIRKAFSTQGFELSQYAEAQITGDNEWTIKDKDQYLIRYENLRLDIFKKGKVVDTKKIRLAISHFANSRYRAVTKEDFEYHAIKSTENRSLSKVRRAIVNERKDLGKIEVIVISDEESAYEDLLPVVDKYLSERKLLGTWLEVKRADYTSVNIVAKIMIPFHVPEKDVVESVKQKITAYLDPISGFKDSRGWPYKKPLNIYELTEIISGEEYVTGIHHIYIDDSLIEKRVRGLIKLEKMDIQVVYIGDN
ncbi:baseplate J/gp47 family protein [Candidatus Uabimicrobium sp. HlEnr_7]|uniref:baseplate J/gp47 family protein n=1 Tax=Candidatus Uabimicrobium helgolandensis TaxID=3095367 RepID=UPI00355665E8